MDIFDHKDAHIQAIAEYLATGANAGCDHCLGFELEHFVVEAKSHRLVPYLSNSSDSPGVRDVLERLSDFYQKQVQEIQPDGSLWLIGLSRPGLSITLEPGAQLEVSIGPALAISEIEQIYHEFFSEISSILTEFGYELITLGYHPTSCAGDIPLIPKARYRLMDHHFQTTGKHGICMMRASASTQVSIDYSDEQDCVRKFRIASALGPLLAFITDNSPIFEGTRIDRESAVRQDGGGDGDNAAITHSGLPLPKRMVRMAIWDDVDSARSLIPPYTFTDGFGYASYANTILSAPAIFRVQLDENGVPLPLLGQESEYTGPESFGSVFRETEFTRPLIEHILSLFFFDVRLKGYMEIRIADSLPLEYALAFTALIKGIFYSEEALDRLEMILADVDSHDIAAAKADLREHAFKANVYHRSAADWLDELLNLGHAGLPAEEQPYLEPLQELVNARQTLVDRYFVASSTSRLQPDAPAQQRYLDAFLELKGDMSGREAAQSYLAGSTAYYHDQLISYGFIPKLYDMAALRRLDAIAQMTSDILDKVVDHYLTEPDYRQLFGFSPLLERLILMPTGYERQIPIQRLDLFLDERSDDFCFCEFNTDGTSAMNEDREATNALSRSGCYKQIQRHHSVQRQELFENWIDAFLRIYFSSLQAVRDPTIAIVDYLASATMYEFEEFRRRFERRGYTCLICDIASLRFDDGILLGTDVDPGRAAKHGPTRIDAVYRRTVTNELLTELETGACPQGARALVDAVESMSICMIGGFRTQIAHCKQLFSILHLPQTLNFMTNEQQDFIHRHIPHTSSLSSQHVDLEAIIANKDSWIIKPEDGYASKGVYAGIDYSDEQWRELMLRHSDDRYIVQTYCQQYPMFNTRPFPVGDDYQPLYTSVEAAQEDERFNPLQLEPWNLLTGLYVYDGHFSGIFDRAGQSGLIVGFRGGITVGSLLIDYDAEAGLALRTRDNDD